MLKSFVHLLRIESALDIFIFGDFFAIAKRDEFGMLVQVLQRAMMKNLHGAGNYLLCCHLSAVGSFFQIMVMLRTAENYLRM